MQRMGSGQGFWTLLSENERDTLSGLGMRKDYPAGATLCLEDDPATQVFVLLVGWVKILSSTKEGHEIVLALRGNGDIVGETAGETTGRRNATIRAIDAVRALTVGYDRFGSFLEAHPGANRAYRRVVTRKFNDTDAILRNRTGTSGAQRLARMLLDLADRCGQSVNGGIYLVLPLTQDELASLVGTSRATVTRALTNWRKRGFIRTTQRHITIIDVEALRRVAGEHNQPAPRTHETPATHEPLCSGGVGHGPRRYSHRDSARAGELDPAFPALETDRHGHQGKEFFFGDAVVAVPDDRLVDVVRRHQG
jgi:CRP/FNR family transcriptional regulator, cyclic AMP receptor protein